MGQFRQMTVRVRWLLRLGYYSRFHLAPDLEGLEARLARSGYDVKQLTDILTAKPKEIRAFLYGHLPPERTQELHDQLLAAGIPLGS